MPTVAISGTGLIGASIGLGLARNDWSIVGWDPDAAMLAAAVARGAVHDRVASFDELVAANTDLVVLAGPPGAVMQQVATMNTTALVIDVTGVKSAVVAAALPRRFVGTHPMAGRELRGVRGASPALFQGATWVVVDDGIAAEDLAAVEQILGLLGARPVRMSAAEHDAAVAMISHLPQVVAAALVNEAADRTRALDLAAGSFRDLTRVAASDPGMWVDLLGKNAVEVVAAITDFRSRLARIAGALESGDIGSIHEFLARGQEIRRTLTSPVESVRVVLADEPGELARVGRAFGEAAVDVRDLQLRHAPYGGGGVLTVSVRHGEAAALRTALQDEGLVVVE